MKARARVFLLLSCSLSLLTTCPHDLDAAERSDDHRLLFTVTVDTVRESVIDSIIVGTGTVAAWREMPISAEAGGLAIVEILADEGDRVRKGQVLARLNCSLLLAQREQHRAGVDEAEASLANAVSDEKRAHAVTSGVLSQQAIEQREMLVKTWTARLASARATLKETEARLAQTEIVAPADAIVASRSAALGQVVQAGGELFRLIQDARIEVNALVPEADLFRASPGQPVRIADPTGRVTDAEVRLVRPVIDERTRLGTVRVALPADTGLKPGMFVRVEIDAGSTPALTVPLRALVWRGGRPAVFTVDQQGTTILRAVTTGRETNAAVEITDGLSHGERVVVEGAGLLNEGEKVRVEVASARSVSDVP